MQFGLTSNLKKIDIRTWINYLFVAYAFAIPVSKAATSLIEALILLLWIVEGNWKYKFSQYIKSPIILTLFTFILYSIISLFWASDLLFGIEYIAKYRHFLLIPILYTSLDKKYIEPIISSFLLSMLFSEIISYGIYLEIWTYRDVLPSSPTPFMNHIAYSIYLSIAATILLNKIFFEENKKHKFYYVIFFISITINLFINGGRTGQVAFIAMLFVLFILNVNHKLKAFLSALVLVVTILTVAINFSPTFQERVKQGETDIVKMIEEKDYNGSLSIRIGLWIAGIDQITDKLDFGSGIGNDMNKIPYYTQKNDISNNFETFADHHNMFITYAIQLGEPGLLTLLFLFYLILRLEIQNKTYKNINIMFITAFFIWSLTGITFHAMQPMVLFTLFTSLGNAIYGVENQEKQP